jgi:hypothetical protein
LYKLGRLETKRYVFEYGERVEKGRLLKDHPAFSTKVRESARIELRKIPAQNFYSSTVRLHHTDDMLEGYGLSHAASSEDKEDFALPNIKAHVVEDRP